MTLIPGTISKKLSVPTNIPRPEYVGKKAPANYLGSHVQSSETIEKMRRAGKLAAEAVYHTASFIRPGITTDELDKIAHEFICDHGAYPSALEYRGYPKSICTSLNEVICHGIPDSTICQEGDILNLDITVFKEGVHGDTNATFPVGEIDQNSRDLIDRTKESLNRAIAVVMPGRPINVIGRVIESYAKRFNLGVVRDFTGHGIHSSFHSGLVIPHYDDPNADLLMQEGMTFTIEPMLTLGTIDYDMWPDGWTAVTKDKKRTAQFEHTLVVTKTGAEILTQHPDQA